jgi:predicted DNA-binding transcriptional regulator AlpA
MLLSRRDLAKLLASSPASIDRLDAAGKLPRPIWLGGSKRYRRADVELWIELGCPSRTEFETLAR